MFIFTITNFQTLTVPFFFGGGGARGIRKFLSTLWLEPKTSHKPPNLYNLSQASRQDFNSSMYPYKLCKQLQGNLSLEITVTINFSHITSLKSKLKKDNWLLHYIHSSRYMVPHQLEFLLICIVPTSASPGTTPKCVALRKHFLQLAITQAIFLIQYTHNNLWISHDSHLLYWNMPQ